MTQAINSDNVWLEATRQLSTPSLVIDLPRVRRNVTRLASYVETHGLRLRPHTKTHKSKKMGMLQLEAGAKGLTAAKVGEAEQFASIENDILVAYPAFDPARATRLALLGRDRTIRVAVDSAEGVNRLAEVAHSAGAVLGILVDLDVGLHRTGVASPQDALGLARHVALTKGVRLDGLFCYPGHIWGTPESQAWRFYSDRVSVASLSTTH